MKTVMEMAFLAGAHQKNTVSYFLPEELEIFADLIRADEREACAKVCEPQEQHDDPLTAWKITKAIRARDNT